MAGGDTLWSSAPFIDRGKRIRQYQDDVGRSVRIIFKIFAGFSLSSSGNIQVQRRAEFFSAGQRRLGAMAKGSVVVVQLCRFKTLKFVDASDAFSFLTERQVPLARILTGRMMFRLNEISVLSLPPFYLQ